LELVLFDLDNTLLDGDSDYEWAQFLIEQGVLERKSYERRNQEFFEQYKAGRLDIYAFLDFQLAPLAQYPRTQLDAWHAQFMALKILPIITAAARRLVAQNLRDGHLCAIVTATNSFVTAPIAREFGVAHLVATEPEEAGGRFTGKVSGTPCFREGKIINVDATVIAQAPKIFPHVHQMKINIAEALELNIQRIGIKATTNEHLGFLGREEGIAAMAVASVDLP